MQRFHCNPIKGVLIKVIYKIYGLRMGASRETLSITCKGKLVIKIRGNIYKEVWKMTRLCDEIMMFK